jgi:hypothetical protein
METITQGEKGNKALNKKIIGRRYKLGLCWFCQTECNNDDYFHLECYDMHEKT